MSLYRGYPPLTVGITAGQEFVRLSVAGELGKDLKHTVAVCDTIAGAGAAVWPGAPGSAQTSQALTVDQDKTLNEVELHAAQFIGQARSQPRTLAFDPSMLIPWVQLILEIIRRRRAGGTTAAPTP